MPDQPETVKPSSVVEVMAVLNKTRREMRLKFTQQEGINQATAQQLQQMVKFMQEQSTLNATREIIINKIKDDLADIKISQRSDSMILQKLSRLWLAEDTGGHKPKSHAIGTWSGWKLVVSFFTILGGLVLAYQILIPILIATNNALLSVSVGHH